MLGKKDHRNENGDGDENGSGQPLNTLIGSGTLFEGTMKVDNSLRIDGNFKAELICSGALTISQSGEAYAQIEGVDVYINGKVKGTVRGEKVRLDSQARLIGDVHTGSLSVSEGAIFHGNCVMDTAGEVEEPENLEPAKLLPMEG